MQPSFTVLLYQHVWVGLFRRAENMTQFVDGLTVGIDLGTSTSAIASMAEDGRPVIIPNSDGEPITPSVIVLNDNGEVVVGPHGDWIQSVNPDRVVVGIKRQMGNPDYVKVIDGQSLGAEFFSALILMKLKQDAEAQLGGPVTNAVITVPYYFNDPCRRATLNAGQIAGLNVIDLLNEPTAATLAYAWQQGDLGKLISGESEREKTILVYDLGGGTFDVTVVRYSALQFRVLATDGDTFLGGLDWTRRLVNHVAEQFRLNYRLDPRDDPRSRLALTDECDDVKRALSDHPQAALQFAYKDKLVKPVITRAEFERLTADLLQRTRDTTEFVLDGVGVDPKQLDEVLLIGGSTYMTGVSAMLEKLCGRTPVRILDPQLAVAQGAAIHAGILQAKETGRVFGQSKAVVSRLQSVDAVDVNSHSLGIEITPPGDRTKKLNHVMIPRNTPLPCEFKQRFVTNTPNPAGILVRLLEGETKEVDGCTFIGDFRITGLPSNLPVGSPVELTYRYDETRRITVVAKELTGGREASCQIHWSSNAETATVDQMQTLVNSFHFD